MDETSWWCNITQSVRVKLNSNLLHFLSPALPQVTQIRHSIQLFIAFSIRNFAQHSSGFSRQKLHFVARPTTLIIIVATVNGLSRTISQRRFIHDRRPNWSKFPLFSITFKVLMDCYSREMKGNRLDEKRKGRREDEDDQSGPFPQWSEEWKVKVPRWWKAETESKKKVQEILFKSKQHWSSKNFLFFWDSLLLLEMNFKSSLEFVKLITYVNAKGLVLSHYKCCWWSVRDEISHREAIVSASTNSRERRNEKL